MQCFFEMTTLNGNIIFIRVDEIVAIEGVQEGVGTSQVQNKFTNIHLTYWGEDVLPVQENVRDIAKLLREA